MNNQTDDVRKLSPTFTKIFASFYIRWIEDSFEMMYKHGNNRDHT